MPVLGPNMLRQDLLYPDAIEAGQRTVLDQLPKRRLPGQLKAIPGSDVTGWGLYIEKKPSSSRKYIAIFTCLVMLAFAISLPIGVLKANMAL